MRKSRFKMVYGLLLSGMSLVAACDNSTNYNTSPSGKASTSNAPEKSVAKTDPSASAPTSKTPALPPAEYSIDPMHSEIGFSVRHMMVSNVKGTFGKYSGSAFINEQDPSQSKVNVEIETISVNTNEKKRDEHLQGADFFDAKKFPKMTFTSTKFERSSTGWKVTGDLTIKETTKPVVLNFEELSPEVKDFYGKTRRGTIAIAKINRKDFGLTWSKALETGGAVVGDDVKIELNLELIKKETSENKKPAEDANKPHDHSKH